MTRFSTFGFLIVAAAFWGFQPSCIKWLVREWTPETLTACRYFLMSVLLLLWAYVRVGKAFWPGKKLWPYLAIMGFVGIMINNVTQFTGLQYTTITNCTLISASSPVIAALISFMVIDERLSHLSWLGIAISFAGVLAVVSNGSWAVLQSFSFNEGDLLCFASQVSWTIYSLISIKVMDHLDPVAATGWAGLLGGFLTLAYGLLTSSFHVVPLSMPATLAFAYTILCGGVIAMAAWNLGLQASSVSVASIFLNVMPVVGMLTGYFLFQEKIGAAQILGAVAICSGVFLTTNSDRIAAWVSGSKNSYQVHE
jgi:drug/metabolite transporter (DMT)-like permease